LLAASAYSAYLHGMQKGDPRLSNPHFGATIRCHRFLGVAQRCRIGLSKGISLLVVAHCFWVLRSEWCQKWCQMAWTTPRAPTSLIAPGGTPRSARFHPDTGDALWLHRGCRWALVGAGETSISLLDRSHSEGSPEKNCPNKSGNHPQQLRHLGECGTEKGRTITVRPSYV
jgi:hypothetical protein